MSQRFLSFLLVSGSKDFQSLVPLDDGEWGGVIYEGGIWTVWQGPSCFCSGYLPLPIYFLTFYTK